MNYCSLLPMSDDIVWPAGTSNILKQKLASVAKLRIGVESLPMTRTPSLPTGMYYLLRGVISVSISSSIGNKELSVFFSQGDWLFPQHYAKTRYICLTAYEIEETQFLYFSFSDLKKIAMLEPDFYLFLFNISGKTNDIISQALNNLIYAKEFRLAYELLDLYYRVNKNASSPSPDNTIYISQYQLSFISNLSRPKLNVELKCLEKQGVLQIGRGRIMINDVDYFENIIKQEILLFRHPKSL